MASPPSNYSKFLMFLTHKDVGACVSISKTTYPYSIHFDASCTPTFVHSVKSRAVGETFLTNTRPPREVRTCDSPME